MRVLNVSYLTPQLDSLDVNQYLIYLLEICEVIVIKILTLFLSLKHLIASRKL